MESQQFVTKDMTIGDVVNKYPEATSIMLGYGLHCVGCSVNPYETIENGCMGHGMDEETVNKLINDINKAIDNGEVKKTDVISITEKAAEKFNEFMKEENKDNFGIRFGVVENGSALQYTLDFAENPDNGEDIFEIQGLRIFINKLNIDLVKGTKIDYIENERGSGFKIDNPGQHEDSGGCGTGCGCH